MIDKIKVFFTKEWWVLNWKKPAAITLYGAFWYVVGAINGAWIQRIINKF